MLHREQRPRFDQTFITAALLLCGAVAGGAQDPAARGALHIVRPMTLQETRYALRPGAPTHIAAPRETLDFLLNSKSRRVEIAGTETGGIVVGPNRTRDEVFVAASLRTKPGEYTVKLSAASAAGEERTTSLTVVVSPRQAVPSGGSRPPVVLLNGWETGFTPSCPVSASSTDTFGKLAQYLVADGVPIVYLFDNCLEDANQSIEVLGNDLGDFLSSLKYDTGDPVTEVDLVCHSMGGLIARAYLAGIQPDQTVTPPAKTLVRDLVLIAVPNFGSFVAGNYVNSIAPGSQSAELVPASSFLWNLATWNQRSDDLRGVNAIAIAGNAGSWLANLTSATMSTNASDGLVSLTSASLGFVAQQSSVTRIVPYCHIDPIAFTNTAFGTFACNAAGIANVTSESHLTGQIVRSFLADTADWKSIGTTPDTDPYLSTKGGVFFAMANAPGSYVTDMTQVQWGTVALLNGGETNVIFYDDFISGTGDYVATTTSLGTVDCGKLAQEVGYFSAARCKVATAIYTVGPLLTGAAGRVVGAGSTITINGTALKEQCNGCEVTAIPAGSTTAQPLTVSSWSDQVIKAKLPAALTGLVTIGVHAVPGIDAINIMVVSASTITAAPSSLQFAYTAGGTVPAAQTIQITNTGTGTLSWSATASDSWLSLSAASGTAPSPLSVSIVPTGLSAGTYNGNIKLSAAGASNSPVTVAVTLTVAGATVPPSLAVTPKALTFNYTAGGAIPSAQSVSITNAGAGALSWTASAGTLWIGLSAASGAAPATLSVSVNPANMAAGTYAGSVQITAAGATGSPASVTVTLVVKGTQPAGSVTAIVNGASYQPGFAPATWVTIFGTNLSESTQTWQGGDFINGLLPTTLQGVSVTIDGLPAYVEYISPTQINVLAPDDAKAGAVQVQVTTAQQKSNSLTVQEQQFAPAFFTIGGAYVAASHANYTLVGKPNLFTGVVTQPAQPGEIIQMYGTGFGPTKPPLPSAQLVTVPAVLANTVEITIGGVTASVDYAGLVEAGLYQLNVTVPPNLPAGDAAVVASIGAVQSQAGVLITVQ